MGYLSNIGYDIDFVNILPNGQIDLKHLGELIRDDTILVSICAVNSETGFRQPLKTIRQTINKKNPNVIFHSDLTQALGKTKFYLSDLDLASFSSHKIYSPKGVGILYKKRGIGMFVVQGAKSQITAKRRKHFYDDYVKSLMAEAVSLGITKEELIEMIRESKDDGE